MIIHLWIAEAPMKEFPRLILVLSLLAGGACGPSWAAREGDRLAEGTWGGPHAELTVRPDGATLELDCAHGTLGEPVAVGRDGRFRVSGTFTAERGGPVREGAEPEARPAVYSGRLEGETLTLVITLEGGEEVGTFQLAHGRSGRITKCL
jgi:hypothetical protein